MFEYHQALGLLPVPELEQRALTLRKQQSIDMVKVGLLCYWVRAKSIDSKKTTEYRYGEGRSALLLS